MNNPYQTPEANLEDAGKTEPSDSSGVFQLLRWVALIPLVIVVFIVSALIAGTIAQNFETWIIHIIGFTAAFFVVLTSFIIAPHFKLVIATISFFLGAIVAWFLIFPTFTVSYNQNGEIYYTYGPLMATYVGGFVGLCFCFYYVRLQRK